MKKILFAIFVAALAGDLAGIYFGEPLLRFVFKPMLVPLVALNFLSYSASVSTEVRRLTLKALFFSWAGDALLLFEEQNEIFFILGLSSFLIAHVFYIILFQKLRAVSPARMNYWLVLPVVAYYSAFIIFLSPYLDGLEWPVRIYGLVISLMLVFALSLMGTINRPAASYIIAGALLFVISDSILAINKFYSSATWAGYAVMITYAFAQWCITGGVRRFDGRPVKQVTLPPNAAD